MILGITGASGIIYAWKLLKVLKQRKINTCAIMTKPAQEILEHELEMGSHEFFALAEEHYKIDDLTAPIASGSQHFDAMVVVPCSMATAGSIANGISKNLLLRVADICMKEGRKLILVPRESPVSTIHLSNLLKLSRVGAIVMPASPAFYHKPKNIDELVDFIVGRILQQLGLEQDLFEPWKTNLS